MDAKKLRKLLQQAIALLDDDDAAPPEEEAAAEPTEPAATEGEIAEMGDDEMRGFLAASGVSDDNLSQIQDKEELQFLCNFVSRAVNDGRLEPEGQEDFIAWAFDLESYDDDVLREKLNLAAGDAAPGDDVYENVAAELLDQCLKDKSITYEDLRGQLLEYLGQCTESEQEALGATVEDVEKSPESWSKKDFAKFRPALVKAFSNYVSEDGEYVPEGPCIRMNEFWSDGFPLNEKTPRPANVAFADADTAGECGLTEDDLAAALENGRVCDSRKDGSLYAIFPDQRIALPVVVKKSVKPVAKPAAEPKKRGRPSLKK